MTDILLGYALLMIALALAAWGFSHWDDAGEEA